MGLSLRSKNLIHGALVSFLVLASGLDARALSVPDLRPTREKALPEAAPGASQEFLPRPSLGLDNDSSAEQVLEAPAPADDVAPTDIDPSTSPLGAEDEAQAAEAIGKAMPSAEIIRELSTLPAPVKELRERLVEAAASGDIERLRPLMEGTPKPPQIMNGESDDPVETLKSFSGDPDGQEILAIMLDILSTGAARIDAGTPEEVYVWPYFAGKALPTLTPPERVELLRIVTAGDLLGMEENGNYNFYRLGISPDGQWRFLTGGD